MIMTREEIEKAAKDYALQDIRTIGIYARAKLIEGFEIGAQWRVNSLWHDGKSRPEHGKYVLLQLKGHNFKIDMWNDCEYMYLEHYSYSSIERWAYLDDLLPDGRDGTE